MFPVIDRSSSPCSEYVLGLLEKVLERSSPSKSRFKALLDVKISWPQMRLGIGLDRQTQFARAIRWLLLAAESEAEGRWDRAKFYFRRCEVKTVDAHWAALREVLIKLHKAFVDASVMAATDASAERAGWHFTEIERLVAVNPVPPGCSECMRSIAEPLLKVLSDKGRFAEALPIASRMAERTEEMRFVRRMFELEWLNAKKRVSQPYVKQNAYEDLTILQRSVEKLEQWRNKYGDPPELFRYIADLLLLSAERRKSAGQLSQAILEARRAHDYNPFPSAAADAYRGYAEDMKQLQANVHTMTAAQAKSAGLADRLSDAREGFAPSNFYSRSEARFKLQEKVLSALAREAFGRAGVDGLSDEQCLAILDALPALSTAGSTESLNSAWVEIQEKAPELAAIPLSSVLRVMRPAEAWVATDADGERAEAPPIQAALKCVKSEENFGDWVFSPFDFTRKAVLSLCMVLVLAAPAISIREGIRSHDRDLAFAQLRQLSTTTDYARTANTAERFFALRPLYGAESRDSEALSIYAEALTRWLASSTQNGLTSIADHLATYRRIAGENGGKETFR